MSCMKSLVNWLINIDRDQPIHDLSHFITINVLIETHQSVHLLGFESSVIVHFIYFCFGLLIRQLVFSCSSTFVYRVPAIKKKIILMSVWCLHILYCSWMVMFAGGASQSYHSCLSCVSIRSAAVWKHRGTVHVSPSVLQKTSRHICTS